MGDAATGAVAVNISSVDHAFNTPTRYLFCGGAGNVVCQHLDGSVVTYTGITAGTQLRASLIKVYKTNTTATNMVAMF